MLWHKHTHIWISVCLCKIGERPNSVVPLRTKIHSGRISIIVLPNMAFILFSVKYWCLLLARFFKKIMKCKYFPIKMMCLFGRYLNFLNLLGILWQFDGHFWVTGWFHSISSPLRLLIAAAFGLRPKALSAFPFIGIWVGPCSCSCSAGAWLA